MRMYALQSLQNKTLAAFAVAQAPTAGRFKFRVEDLTLIGILGEGIVKYYKETEREGEVDEETRRSLEAMFKKGKGSSTSSVGFVRKTMDFIEDQDLRHKQKSKQKINGAISRAASGVSGRLLGLRETRHRNRDAWFRVNTRGHSSIDMFEKHDANNTTWGRATATVDVSAVTVAAWLWGFMSFERCEMYTRKNGEGGLREEKHFKDEKITVHIKKFRVGNRLFVQVRKGSKRRRQDEEDGRRN